MSLDWHEITLAEAPIEIIDGDRGKSYPKHSDFSDDGHCLFLNATNVTAYGFDFSECQFISEQKDEELRKGKLARNDVVLTTRGTLGNTALYNDSVPYDHVRINSGMVIMRTDIEKLLPLYLYGFLRSPRFKKQVEQLRSGVAQPQLPIRDINKIKFLLPPKVDQERIVNIFAPYDELIENNCRRMALLEDSARQLFHEWFIRLRFPGHEHARIVDGVLEGWERSPASEAIAINPQTKLSDEDEHWWVEMADLDTNSMVIHNAIKKNGRNGSKFKNGDTLFARITPCLENGKTAFVNFMMENEVGRGSTEFIVLRSLKLTPEFLYCLARTYDFRENAIKSMIGASGRQRVQESCFDKHLLLVPPQSILVLFNEFVEPIFDQIKNLHLQNQQLRAARDLLLPRLMNGEIAA